MNTTINVKPYFKKRKDEGRLLEREEKNWGFWEMEAKANVSKSGKTQTGHFQEQVIDQAEQGRVEWR